MSQVTRLLSAIDGGDPKAASELLPLVYDELRRVAASKIAQEQSGGTLQATDLVHEAYLRLVGPANADGFSSRRHFFSAAAEAMRRILVERARARNSLKRGGMLARQVLEDAIINIYHKPDELLQVNEALDALAEADPRAAEIVKMRYFLGFSVTEASEALDISLRTASEAWSYARAWLRVHLSSDSSLG